MLKIVKIKHIICLKKSFLTFNFFKIVILSTTNQTNTTVYSNDPEGEKNVAEFFNIKIYVVTHTHTHT